MKVNISCVVENDATLIFYIDTFADRTFYLFRLLGRMKDESHDAATRHTHCAVMLCSY